MWTIKLVLAVTVLLVGAGFTTADIVVYSWSGFVEPLGGTNPWGLSGDGSALTATDGTPYAMKVFLDQTPDLDTVNPKRALFMPTAVELTIGGNKATFVRGHDSLGGSLSFNDDLFGLFDGIGFTASVRLLGTTLFFLADIRIPLTSFTLSDLGADSPPVFAATLPIQIGGAGSDALLTVPANAPVSRTIVGVDQRRAESEHADAWIRLARMVESLAAEILELNREIRTLREENDRLRTKPGPLSQHPSRAKQEQTDSELPGAAAKRPTAAPTKPIQVGRFLDHGDFVEDTQSGLLWQKDGTASGKLNFYQAHEYAVKLQLGGYAGWRVPTKEELASIFPAVDPPFTNTKYTKGPYVNGGPHEWNSYWTSSIDSSAPDYAYVYQWYADGGANNCYASTNWAYVRCVHNPINR